MEQDLEDEIADVEMYHFNLTEQIITLRKFSNSSITKSVQPPPFLQPSVQHQQEQATESNHDNSQQQTVSQSSAEHLEPAEKATASNLISHDVVSHTPVVHNVGQCVSRAI